MPGEPILKKNNKDSRYTPRFFGEKNLINNRVTVRIWLPQYWKLKVGHVSIETQKEYRSFWPGENSVIGQVISLSGVKGSWCESYEKDKGLNGGEADYQIELYTLDVNEINKFYAELNQGKGVNWALFGSIPGASGQVLNCCSISLNALLAGGINSSMPKNRLTDVLTDTYKYNDISTNFSHLYDIFMNAFINVKGTYYDSNRTLRDEQFKTLFSLSLGTIIIASILYELNIDISSPLRQLSDAMRPPLKQLFGKMIIFSQSFNQILEQFSDAMRPLLEQFSDTVIYLVKKLPDAMIFLLEIRGNTIASGFLRQAGLGTISPEKWKSIRPDNYNNKLEVGAIMYSISFKAELSDKIEYFTNATLFISASGLAIPPLYLVGSTVINTFSLPIEFYKKTIKPKTILDFVHEASETECKKNPSIKKLVDSKSNQDNIPVKKCIMM